MEKVKLTSFVVVVFLWLQTDPENTDYVCENGATRNFQAQKLMEDEENRKQKEEEEEEQNNPMKVRQSTAGALVQLCSKVEVTPGRSQQVPQPYP